MPGSASGQQTFTNRELPPGVAGDWAGANIRASVSVGPWALVAPPSGTTVGVIGWANPATGICSNYFQPNSFPGFIHREQQSQGLQTSGAGILVNVAATQVLSGYPVTALAQGTFWGLFQGSASVGNTVYANPTTGALIAAASGGSVTASNTSITTSGTGNTTLTLVGTTTGTVAIGQIVVSGALPPGTYIVSGSGTSWVIANLDGTALPTITTTAATFYGQQAVQWLVTDNVAAFASVTATLAAESGLGPFGVLNVSAVGSGTIYPGQWIQSSGTVAVPLTANIQIIQQLTGTTGGIGTYLTTGYIAVASGQTFTTYNGQMAKISSWAPL
jgi:hypothetical protein